MEIKNMTGNDLMVNINNVLYSYDDEGTGTIPVIFIHGFPFGKQTWQPQLAAISKTNRAIAYDIRGYGKSEPGSEVPSIGLYADDLINFMDALEIEKAIVCGLSMGGYILLNAVTLCPHRFKAVILCDTQCIADTPEIKDSRNKVITQIIAGKKAEFADGFLGKVFSNDSLENKKELVQQVRDIIMSTSSTSLTATLSALANRSETCTDLGKIQVPTLVLCGENDILTPPSQSRFLSDKIAHSEMHVIKNAAHLSNLEQPGEFNERILKFIAGLPE